MAMLKYMPIKISYFLLKKKMLSPVHYSILTTLKNVSISYQCLIMMRLLKRDVEADSKYRNLVQLVKSNKFLRHIYSRIRSDIG